MTTLITTDGDAYDDDDYEKQAEPLEALYPMFPSAEPHWGAIGVDIEWQDCHIIVTADGLNEFAVGIYRDGRWLEGYAPDAYIVVKGAQHAVDFIDRITNIEAAGPPVVRPNWADIVVPMVEQDLAAGRIPGEILLSPTA